MKDVCEEEAAGGGRRRGGGEEPGIQNQKQEPHTKMWGKTPEHSNYATKSDLDAKAEKV